MDSKTIITLILLGVAMVGVFIILIFNTMHAPDLSKEDSVYSIGYYEQLDKDCEEKEDVSCCKSSVSNMRDGGYELVHDFGCLGGYNRNMMRCPGSYQWCEPIDEKKK